MVSAMHVWGWWVGLILEHLDLKNLNHQVSHVSTWTPDSQELSTQTTSVQLGITFWQGRVYLGQVEITSGPKRSLPNAHSRFCQPAGCGGFSQASPPLLTRSSDFVPIGSQGRYARYTLQMERRVLDTYLLKRCNMHF